jgi:urease beta subunit
MIAMTVSSSMRVKPLRERETEVIDFGGKRKIDISGVFGSRKVTLI